MTATPAPLSAPQVRAYLDRIGLASMPADAAPSVELLDALIRAHQLSVPFSTADIAGRGIAPSLELDALYKKIVEDRHGGFCFGTRQRGDACQARLYNTADGQADGSAP